MFTQFSRLKINFKDAEATTIGHLQHFATGNAFGKVGEQILPLFWGV